MIPLQPPSDIDYSKFHNINGCATKIWGPHAWNFLFTSIMGTFPPKVETNEQLLVAKYFKRLFHSLGFTMPCVYCRNSYKEFYEQLPIENYLDSREQMMYWLYLMKDKVNKKLLKQEKQCLNDEKIRLKVLYKNKEISKEDYYKSIAEFKQKTFNTIATPPFIQVLEQYEKCRAVCSPKNLSCVLPSKSESS
jgi:hypothetical protein